MYALVARILTGPTVTPSSCVDCAPTARPCADSSRPFVGYVQVFSASIALHASWRRGFFRSVPPWGCWLEVAALGCSSDGKRSMAHR